MTTEHEYIGEDRRAPPETSWHLKKEINVTIIISVLGIALAMVKGYTDLKSDIALIQADAVVIHQKIQQQDTELDKAITVLQGHYSRMDSKLDRLIERTIK